MRRERSTTRRLMVPVVLVVTVITGIAAVATTATGCGDDKPSPVDAATSDAPVDTPIV